MTESIDPLLGPFSFAYRPGLGTRDCVRALAEARDEGTEWVLRADIDECFDSIPHSKLLDALDNAVDDVWLTNLVQLLLRRPVRYDGWQRRRWRGTPQGAPLSPLMANLYLEAFDHELLAGGFRVIRFADDFAIPLTNRVAAEKARNVVDQALSKLDLRVNTSKTSIESFNGGFQFVGVDFDRRFPRATTDATRTPKRRSLYVSKQGAWVGLSGGRITVKKGDTKLLSIPRSQVERVVLFGNVGFSAWLRNTALYENLDFVFLSSRGRYLGRLVGAGGTGAHRSEQQRHLLKTNAGKRMASAVVAGKIANMRALLLRRSRLAGSDLLVKHTDHLEVLRRRALETDRVSSLFGLEGTATAEYFGVFGDLLPENCEFTRRTRRPPLDATNAALSFGYALLVSETAGACAGVGLDPDTGFLHGPKRGRPSLALDLMEEFRPLIVDTVVLELFRRGTLSDDSGAFRPDRGVWLTTEAKPILIGALEDRLLTEFSHVPSGTRTTYRRALHLQARQIADLVDGTRDRYMPVRWR